MKMVLGLLLLIGAAFLVVALARRLQRPREEASWPVYARKPLSPPEQQLYQRLTRAFPNHIILSQVALPAMVGVKKGHDFRTWNNRFNRLYADFVICERDFRVAAVIELDDRSHDHPRRQDADARKAAALAAAGIPLHRLNVNPLPDVSDLQQLIAPQAQLTGS